MRSVTVARPLCWLASYLKSSVFFWTQVYITQNCHSKRTWVGTEFSILIEHDDRSSSIISFKMPVTEKLSVISIWITVEHHVIENVQSFPWFCSQIEIKKKFMRLVFKFCVNDKTIVKIEISYMSKQIKEICFHILLKYWAEKYTKLEMCVGAYANGATTAIYTGDGQNNGNASQYREKTPCVGCTEWTLVVNIFCYSFVCLHCVVPGSVHYRLCLVTFHTKVLQNGRPVRFLKETDCWWALSCSICNQNGQLNRCIQSSSSQGFDGILNSWEGLISWEE